LPPLPPPLLLLLLLLLLPFALQVPQGCSCTAWSVYTPAAICSAAWSALTAQPTTATSVPTRYSGLWSTPIQTSLCSLVTCWWFSDIPC
jgi:hypothetical protein